LVMSTLIRYHMKFRSPRSLWVCLSLSNVHGQATEGVHGTSVLS
jgi:hypothetical protein